jgi:glycosyltransferase involved in cell wall biosynthesis
VKVLHVYRTYFPDPQGGLQEALRQICLAVKPFGIDNTIFTLSPDPHPPVLDREEARVVRSRSWGAPASCDLGGRSAFRQFRRLADEADLVHYLFPWPFADLLHRAVPRGKPVVMTYVSDIVRQRWLRRAYGPLMWRTLRAMNAIVANAPVYAQTSPVLAHPELARRVTCIPLGITEASYPPRADDAILRRNGLDGEPYFLFVGVLRYYKGLRHLIRSAPRVGARIVIAGSGPEADALQDLAIELRTRNVIFLGTVSDAEKVALIRGCRALVLPSNLRSEAYGMVLVEAAMFGRPMICCEIGTGTSFVNADGETGFVVAPNDAEALAAAQNRLLHDECLARTMGAAARRRYERLFSGAVMGRAYAEVFVGLSDRTCGRGKS